MALAVIVWSIAAVSHAVADRLPGLSLPTLNLDATTGASVVMLTGAAAGFALVRFILGLGEAGNFPACIKTVAEWFPRRERALATGLFNSGTNVGALATPLAVLWITAHWGWKWAFIATGLTGFPLGHHLVAILSTAGTASAARGVGIGADSKRPAGE